MKVLRDYNYAHLFMVWSLMVITVMSSCQAPVKEVVKDDKAQLVLDKLLRSLESKDITSLKETMSSSGDMELVLTNGEIMSGVAEFVDFHEGWFRDTTWSMRHEIVDFQLYENVATATVKAYYSEPDRDGAPYFHNMVVSYVLHKFEDGKWAVIKDQATSFDKSN